MILLLDKETDWTAWLTADRVERAPWYDLCRAANELQEMAGIVEEELRKRKSTEDEAADGVPAPYWTTRATIENEMRGRGLLAQVKALTAEEREKLLRTLGWVTDERGGSPAGELEKSLGRRDRVQAQIEAATTGGVSPRKRSGEQ